MPERMMLFDKKHVAGVFKGFTEGGLEFHADLVLPYKSEFQNSPMHGQFVLVQLENPDEAVLGRITSFSAEGKLSFGAGEEFNIRAMEEDRQIPEELRENYLRYKVNIRVLGVLRKNGDSAVSFVPSIRRLPHVGSPVAFPSGMVLRALTGHNEIASAIIGRFALGEYVYMGADKDPGDIRLQPLDPEVSVRFSIDKLVSRRSFVFARAGFGKSNLTKLLFSTLYCETPTVEKKQGRRVPVGTVIFDPDGEYFWPDDKGRPGLCDVPQLEDKIVVFTNRRSTSHFYQSFVAGGVRLDIRQLPPADVIGIALSPEKQDQQNVRKLRGLGYDAWRQLVDIIHEKHNQTDLDAIADIIGLEKDKQQQGEALAARANMTAIVKMLHDQNSRLVDHLILALQKGKLCVVDISQMRGTQGMILAGIILRTIFNHNQEQFTEAEPETIPTIAVVEEAQSVLDDRSSASEPFIAWVKEGRKYDLGAMLITQQPGSISTDILSQGDNWFVFHLLSAADLSVLHKANAHYSDDLLGTLLNEPLVGHCVFWSSVGGKEYPLSTRIRSFEDDYETRDPRYEMPAMRTFATILRESGIVAEPNELSEEVTDDSDGESEPNATSKKDHGDQLASQIEQIAARIKENKKIMDGLKTSNGVAWGAIQAEIRKYLPSDTYKRDDRAYKMVISVMEALLGTKDESWGIIRHEGANGKVNSYFQAL
jgi:hypothetical protein